jgi:hypothetical protein
MFQMVFLADLSKHIALNSEQNERVPNATDPLNSLYIFSTILTSKPTRFGKANTEENIWSCQYW